MQPKKRKAVRLNFLLQWSLSQMFPLEFFEIASQHACFFRTAICRNTLVRTISTLHLGILQNTCLNDVSKKEWQS